MGLLQSLKLVPPGNKDTTAKPAALRRARLAARLRKGQQRAVLEAAIESAARPDSNTAEHLDSYVDDPDNPGLPASTMASRSAYKNMKGGKPEDKGLAGGLPHETEVEVRDADNEEDPSIKTDFEVMAKIGKREIWPERIGNGERLYTRDGEGGMRKPDGFKSPEPLVMTHEHLHLIISAHVSARVKEFANAAFGRTAFDEPTAARLKEKLEELAKQTEKIVNHWFDQVSVPDRPGEIPYAKKVTERLLEDGTLERRVRTALLTVVRKNARGLAAFRKG
jgi:hypothetical protein